MRPAVPAADAHAWRLPVAMAVGGALGVVVGSWLGPRWQDPALEPLVVGVRLVGQVFLALLTALIVPLVVTSLIVGVQQFGSGARVARLAGGTALYFLGTTALAVLTGLALVVAIHPGSAGVAPGAAPATGPQGLGQALEDLAHGLFPTNLVAAAGEGNVLGLIVFSLLFGAALAGTGEARGATLAVLEGVNRALMRLVGWVVRLAPLGIFGLVAERLGREGGGAAAWSEVGRLAAYAATVMAGLALHALVTLPLFLVLLGKRRPRAYAAGMSESLLTAFGTASSAASLPVTLRCVVERNGVSARAADFVLPIGTTVNMDGTALYEAVAVVFIAQSLGIDLSLGQLVLVSVTATLAAVGAAAIPQAGLVTMVLVLRAVDLPAEGIGLLLSIDWILDRFRTAVNVWGDSIGAAVIDRRLAAASEP